MSLLNFSSLCRGSKYKFTSEYGEKMNRGELREERSPFLFSFQLLSCTVVQLS